MPGRQGSADTLRLVQRHRVARRKKAIKRVANSRVTPRNSIVHKFRRNMAPFTVTGNAVYTPYLGSFDYQFGNVTTATDFTNLFEYYRITHIQMRAYLKVDPSAQSAATAIYPKIWYCMDHNDNSTPASINELRERSDVKVKVLSPNRPVKIDLKPSVLAETYRSAVTTTYSPKWKQWLPCENTNVPHYGFKYAIDDFTNTNYKIDWEFIAFFECKNTK